MTGSTSVVKLLEDWPLSLVLALLDINRQRNSILLLEFLSSLSQRPSLGSTKQSVRQWSEFAELEKDHGHYYPTRSYDSQTNPFKLRIGQSIALQTKFLLGN